MSTGCTWLDQLIDDTCPKCHEDYEDCAEDGSPCPFAAILRALPTASDEQIEAATAILTDKGKIWQVVISHFDEQEKGGVE